MLNISKQSVSKQILEKQYETLNRVQSKKTSKVLRRIIYVAFFLTLIILFLPWTQNIRSNGYVTTLKPDQKPVSLNSTIAGKIEKWYVQEGDIVKKGDTILKISEVKDDYFDDKLLPRTKEQVDLKELSVITYADKIATQNQQLEVLKNQRDLKLEQSKIKLQQATLKVQNDSMSYLAAKNNYETAVYQLKRMDSLYAIGLKSLTDLEKRRIKAQETSAYLTEAYNKWLNSKSELINLQLDINNVSIKYQEDVNKINSDRYSTLSNKLDTETSLSKLQNQYSNYLFRNGLYYITAPQDGFITKTVTSGIGEILKEGENILTLMPKDYDLAVEIYIDPIDLPLVSIGEKVRIQFDGWPAIVFSGWPTASHGTYGGEIYAIDQYLSENGKYRLLVKPDETDYAWPTALRYGSGTSSLIMLKDVRIWYELWRKINGFPPDYYVNKKEDPYKKK